jgi:hypothetical protein
MLSCLRACRIHPCGFFWLLQISSIKQSVGFLLQTTIGGVAIDFRPQQLSERVFKFKMNSRNVGFHVYNLRSFTRDQYKVFFFISRVMEVLIGHQRPRNIIRKRIISGRQSLVIAIRIVHM